MRLVAIQLALAVCYDPRLDEYGQCWPTVPTLAEWCQLSHTGVRKILRRLEGIGILMTTDRRPRSSLYTLELGVDPWGYCHPVGGRKRGDESTTDIETDILPTGTKPRKTYRLNRYKTLENVPVEPKEPTFKPTRTGKNVFAGSAQMDSSKASHATAARLKNTISDTPSHTTHRTTSDSDETRETQYLRTLNIRAKDVYTFAQQYPTLAWPCMTAWANEGGEAKGVLVERLRRISAQAEAAQQAARRRKKERGVHAAQDAARDAARAAETVALRARNRARMALLSEAQQAAARQGATARFWADRECRWLYNAYRVAIEQAAASAAAWEALPGDLLPQQLEACLAAALDALDEGTPPGTPPDGEPPVVMGLFGPIARASVPARNGRSSFPPPTGGTGD